MTQALNKFFGRPAWQAEAAQIIERKAELSASIDSSDRELLALARKVLLDVWKLETDVDYALPVAEHGPLIGRLVPRILMPKPPSDFVNHPFAHVDLESPFLNVAFEQPDEWPFSIPHSFLHTLSRVPQVARAARTTTEET